MKINELLTEGWGADEITPYSNGYTIWHKKQSAVRGEGNYWVYKTPEEFRKWDDSMKWDLEKTIKSSEPIAKANSYQEAAAIMKGVKESATAGATSSGNIATVVNPHLSPGTARGKKSYTGDPWGGKSGTKSPPQPKPKQPKVKNGTAKNALDMKNNIFGENPIRR